MNQANNSHGSKIPIVPKEYKTYFYLLATCFALWGMSSNLTANLVSAFAKIFSLNAVDSSMVQVCYYVGYAVMAIPAAYCIKRYSYRFGLLLGLGLYIIGASGFIPSGLAQNYDCFLAAIFVIALGMATLETTCNPFILKMGNPATGVQRLNLAQVFNSFGCIFGLLLAKFLILSNLNPASADERLTMPSEALVQLRSHELFWLCAPYVVMIAVVAIIWLIFYRSDLSEREAGSEVSSSEAIKKLLKLPRYILGVLSIFCYVGAQTAVWTWIITYSCYSLGILEAEAANFFIYSMLVFTAFRIICAWLMNYISPGLLLFMFAILGVLTCFGSMYLSDVIGVICMVAISASLSLQFPTIYGIALNNLGQESKVGAAGIMLAISGGAVIPILMGAIVDSGSLAFLATGFSQNEAALRGSFLLPALCMAFVAGYAWKYRK